MFSLFTRLIAPTLKYDPAPMISLSDWRTATKDLRFPATLKQTADDFIVEEIPAYEPSGEGEHLFLWIEKRDLSAERLLDHVSRSLDIDRSYVGMAGMKDRHAVTRQYLSVPAVCQKEIARIESDLVKVLRHAKHQNKLKTGHLLGNRFEIVLRTQHPGAIENALQIATFVATEGVPNYYGDQRFGVDHETLQLGYDLLTGQISFRKIPFSRRKFLMRLALSSLQSDLFNAVLFQRIQDGLLQTALDGDVMQKRDTGGMFTDENLDLLTRRFESGEIVPTGPMFGPKMMEPKSVALQREQQVLDERGISRERFSDFHKLTSGTRRALIIWPEDLIIAAHEDVVKFTFNLPTGSYATIVLDEFALIGM